MLRFRTDCAREHTGKCGCIDTNGLTDKSTSHQPPPVADKCIVGNVTLQLRILLATGRLAWKYTGRIVSTLYGSISGVNPSDVQVHTERNLPTITRERKTEEQAHDYPETCYGNFERTLTLPQGVEADEIVARYQHGVLEIRVPLSAKLAGRKIPIQIEQQTNRKLEPKAA